MKFNDLTIDQFQRIYAISSSDVLDDADKMLGVTAIIEGKTIDECRAWPMTKLTARYKEVVNSWKTLPQLASKTHFRCGGKTWQPTVFTDELIAGQSIHLMSIDMSSEAQVIMNLHMIMATLCRERKLIGCKPYDGAKHAQRAELFKMHATIGQVWGAASFFLLSGQHFFESILASSMESKVKEPTPTS